LPESGILHAAKVVQKIIFKLAPLIHHQKNKKPR
jgi:hypothetical protein